MLEQIVPSFRQLLQRYQRVNNKPKGKQRETNKPKANQSLLTSLPTSSTMELVSREVRLSDLSFDFPPTVTLSESESELLSESDSVFFDFIAEAADCGLLEALEPDKSPTTPAEVEGVADCGALEAEETEADVDAPSRESFGRLGFGGVEEESGRARGA